ncbi:hypothetical protein [Flavobacterium sp. IMCC34518]|uniref:hypothetical protein n=1 Tax=Flavobacterium sp. IMCC34518 TaxID=3003623 RepID=UPI0022ABDB63|nr:hypothetical protein [Flavobacterium sp. IMCC34518]
MKVNLLVVLFLFFFQFSFSQKEEMLKGKVFNQNLPIKGVAIINFNTKAQTSTDQFGNFSIPAKTDDLLVFISKEYQLKKLLVNEKLYDEKELTVYLNLKPEELEEVVITKMPSLKLSGTKGYEQGKVDEITLDKAASKPRTGVYDGSIENGADINRIFGMVLGLFIKDKEPPKEKGPEIEFAVLAKNTCNQKFYLETLKLKPEEIDLFLQFCDTDPKSKKLIKNSNVLSMMDFLSAKNIEFQKIKN